MIFEKFPTGIYVIILAEFLGKFAFCGMRTLLPLYLRNVLLFPEAASTVLYHVFIMVCFTVPFLGAVIADGCVGRFRTILQFFFICTMGHIIFTLAAIPTFGMHSVAWTMAGLSLVAMGSGGIKPCMSAFGGDQITLPEQQSLVQPFFSSFYSASNLGTLAGMLSTPLLRKITCFGDDSCYPLGFGLPASFAGFSFVLFVAFKRFYRIREPNENVMGNIICCATYALTSKMRKKDERKEHWLDYAKGKYDATLINDMKAVLAIFLLFIPLPVFWSLLVQQGSRWIFQATRMDGHIMGLEILPDQVQALSPLMVMVFIPVFNKIVYPSLRRSNILVSPLQRMAAGGIVAGMGFICAGLLEYKLQETYSPVPPNNGAQMILINTLPCDLQVQIWGQEPRSLPNGQMLTIADIQVVNFTTVDLLVNSPETCGDELWQQSMQKEVEVKAGETKTVLVGVDDSGALETYALAVEDLKKPLSGRPKIRLIFIRGENCMDPSTVYIYDENGLSRFYFIGTKPYGVSNYTEMHSGRYTYYVTYADSFDEEFQGFLELKGGGVYTLILREYDSKIAFAQNFAMTPPNHIHILWLLPQYALISIAEILFGISGLDFCFTQAPKSMKTMTMAAWYFMVACGNVLVILITQAHIFTCQANEFFLFAVLMLLDMALFKWMCSKYRGRAPDAEESTPSFFDDDDDKYPLYGQPSLQIIHS